MSMRSLKVYGLALLLASCTPKSSIIYMSAEIDRPDRLTYSVSDQDDRIKKEILETQEKQGQIPHSLLETIMKETSQRGIVVQVEEIEERIEISVYAPILYIERDGVEAYFKSKITFYDKNQDGKLDMPPETRKMLINSANTCEQVLKNYKKIKKILRKLF